MIAPGVCHDLVNAANKVMHPPLATLGEGGISVSPHGLQGGPVMLSVAQNYRANTTMHQEYPLWLQNGSLGGSRLFVHYSKQPTQ